MRRWYQPGTTAIAQYKSGTTNAVICSATVASDTRLRCNGTIPSGATAGSVGPHPVIAKDSAGFKSLATFAKQQEQLRQQMSAFGQGAGIGAGVGAYEEQIRQNLALFDRAMKMFSPFAFAKTDEQATPPKAEPAAAPADDALVQLRRQMEEADASRQSPS